MAIYNKRIEFNREKLLDHYVKRDSLADFVYGIVRFIGIVIQNIYCVSSYLVLSWILLLPIGWVRSDLYSRAENYLYNSLLFIVSSWSMAAGATIVEAGEEFKHLIEEPQDLKTQNNELTNHVYNRKKEQKSIPAKIRYSDTSKSVNSCFNQSGDAITILNEAKNDLKRTNNCDATPTCPTRINNNNNNNEKFIRNLSNDIEPRKNYQKKPRILLLCNHISTADVPLMMQAFSTLTNQSLLWVLDAQFKPTNFGLVCMSHGDFFIAKDSFTDGSLRDQVLKHPDRNLLVLFPEGGFWRKRLEGSNRYALKNGLPMTRYVTHPRFGAFKDLIDPSVEVTHIVDATLLYDDIRNPLSILDIVLGNRKEPAILHYKVYERNQINPTEEWLRNIWLEKDKLLQQYQEDRSSVYKRFEGTLRSAKLDWFKVLSVHLFYLLVCYTIYRMFSATSVTMLKARDLYYSNI